MKKLSKVMVVLLTLSLLFTGCSSSASKATASTDSNSGDTTATPNSDAKQMKYAFIGRSTGNPYVEKCLEGFQTAVTELGQTAIVKAPDQATAEGQIQMVEELIAQQVQAIAVASNDFDALTPVLKKATEKGIKVISVDSALNPESRLTHVNQADPVAIGKTLINAAYDMTGGEGEIAILSATSQSANQNLWIENMKKELEDPKYAKLKLIKVAYGDDLRDKSVLETEGLIKAYPNLKCIIAPTTVGIAAAAKVLTDKKLAGKIALTGLGLPSEMSEYMDNGVCGWMYLWNPIDLGYMTAYTLDALATGEITGEANQKFVAGKLGEKQVIQVGDGTETMLGDPFKFDASNIAEWKTVY